MFWEGIGYAVLSGIIVYLWFKVKEYLKAIHEADIKIVELTMAQTSDTMEAALEDYRGEVSNLRQQMRCLEDEKSILQDDFLLMTSEMKKQKGRAASAHTQRGLLLEKWCPFLEHEEIDPDWDAKDWSFLGQPIDYIVFNWFNDKEENAEKGKVIMLDVKSGASQLSTKQRRIRDLIKAGKVEWKEIRLD